MFKLFLDKIRGVNKRAVLGSALAFFGSVPLGKLIFPSMQPGLSLVLLASLFGAISLICFAVFAYAFPHHRKGTFADLLKEVAEAGPQFAGFLAMTTLGLLAYAGTDESLMAKASASDMALVGYWGFCLSVGVFLSGVWVSIGCYVAKRQAHA